MDHASYLAQLSREFLLSKEQLRTIAADFELAMREGLAGRPSSLKMLPSYIASPSGKESGAVLAVDFGGTNVRVLEAELDGAGQVSIRVLHSVPLIDPKGSYNHVAVSATAEQLFGFIADRLGEIAKPGLPYSMGLTFSFPCEQRSISSATLLHWTKEFRTQNVEGKDIGGLLNAALASRGLGHIRCVAIINDTVGTQLTAAYARSHVDIASICGTGHNTCYLEPRHPLSSRPMIVNMESGNFDRVPQTRFDCALDAASERPGTQRLEKMVSGYYLGEVVRQVLLDMHQQGLLPASSRLELRQTLGGALLSRILGDWGDHKDTASALETAFGWQCLELTQLQAIHAVVTLLASRSARLVAATFLGTVRHIDPDLLQPHVVAIDGSLYEKMPHYAGWLQHALDAITPGEPDSISATLTKDGSGLGAAIAAATAAAS